MALSPAAERRIVTFLPPLVVAALLIPFAVRQNAWNEWQNAYWFLQRQAEHVSAHGVPTFFLHTRDGTFYPFFAFYGGFTLGLLGFPAALFGAWPVFLASMVAAVVGGYLGIWWAALNLGLSRRLAALPALIYATTPYVLSDAYGRGAWAELVAINTAAVLVGGWTAVLRSEERYPKLALAALVGSGALLAGTHNLTLMMTALVLPLILLALMPVSAAGIQRGAVLARAGRGAVAVAVGVGLTGAWLVPNVWLGPNTYITDLAINQEGIRATAPFEQIGNVLSPWPIVPDELPGFMWIYAQGPALAIFWVLVVLAFLAIRRGAPHRVIATSGALIAVGIGLLVVITHPLWWLDFPRLLQTVQMPMRLVPYLAIATALVVTVLLVGLGQRRARMPLVTALVIVVAAQMVGAIYIATSAQPSGAFSAPNLVKDDIRVDEEPFPFSGSTQVTRAQFRVLGRPKGEQTAAAAIPSAMSSQLTSDAATVRGTANVGDQIATDIVESPLVRVSGDARITGRDMNGLTLLTVTRTDANNTFTAVVRGQCALCLSTAGGAWQLRVGRLITLLSFALLVMACVVGVGQAARRRGMALPLSPGRRRGSASRSR